MRERVRAGRVPERLDALNGFAMAFGTFATGARQAPALSQWRAAARELVRDRGLGYGEACYCVALGREAWARARSGKGAPEDPTDGLFELLLGDPN